MVEDREQVLCQARDVIAIEGRIGPTMAALVDAHHSVIARQRPDLRVPDPMVEPETRQEDDGRAAPQILHVELHLIVNRDPHDCSLIRFDMHASKAQY
jgi:hypothetical protein